MSALNKAIMVLNKSWMPIRIVPTYRAITLVFAGKASAIDVKDWSIYNWENWVEKDLSEKPYGLISTSSCVVEIPEIIVLSTYDKVFRKDVRLTKRNIYIRDGYRCFTPDTLILLANGQFVPIEEIKIGDNIIDAYGDSQKVEYTNNRECLEDIYKIRVRGNGDGLKCTGDHTILTWNKDGEMGLKKANKCQKGGFRYVGYGDFLSEVSINNETFGKIIKQIDLSNYIKDLSHLKIDDNYIKHYSGKKIKRKIKINSNFGRLIGYFLAEGSISNDGKQIIFAFHLKESNFSKEVKEIVKEVLGIDSIEKIYKDSNSRIITVCSTVFNSFLRKWCFINKEKRIVNKNFPINYLKGILYGMTLGDGNINKELKRITIMLKVGNLIRDIYIISKICGINPLLSKTGYRKDGRTYKSCIYKCSEYNKIGDIIKNEDTYSGKNLNYRIIRNDRILSPISSISKEKYEGKVFDLQVSGTHTYIANLICVHNCQYTGKQIKESDADIDHVKPRSKGGINSWDNMVVCTKEINRMKADMTPKQAGLKLIRKPKKPNADRMLIDPKIKVPESWSKFIKGNK